MSDNKPALVTRVEPEWADKLKTIARLLSQPGNPRSVATLVRGAIHDRYLRCNERGCEKEATRIDQTTERCLCTEHAQAVHGYAHWIARREE